MFIAILFAPLFVGISLPDIIAIMNNGEMNHHLGLMRYIQTMQGITLFILPAFFLAYLFSGNVTVYFGFRNPFPKRWLLMVLFVMITVIPLINLLAKLNDQISFPESLSFLERNFRSSEDAARNASDLFLSTTSIYGLFFNILMIALIPAIGEELIFRGIIQKIFVKWTGNIHIAIVISSLLFSAMHLQFYGIFPRWLLGIMFGYLLAWSGSIWLPVFAHFINNAVIAIVGYLTHKGHIPVEAAEYGSSWSAIPVTLAMTAVCILLLWKMKRESARIVPLKRPD